MLGIKINYRFFNHLLKLLLKVKPKDAKGTFRFRLNLFYMDAHTV